jgi:hypothetical protein
MGLRVVYLYKDIFHAKKNPAVSIRLGFLKLPVSPFTLIHEFSQLHPAICERFHVKLRISKV